MDQAFEAFRIGPKLRTLQTEEAGELVAELAAAYREALRSIVASAPHDNLSVVEGLELLPKSGLTADLLHPGDDGMATIGERLVRHLRTEMGRVVGTGTSGE